ncbi:MAG TPA: hypothetical protein PKM46_07740 [Thermosynergistes sp.]|nr:hypothetical protein [Thermosynergistes sp.]
MSLVHFGEEFLASRLFHPVFLEGFGIRKAFLAFHGRHIPGKDRQIVQSGIVIYLF